MRREVMITEEKYKKRINNSAFWNPGLSLAVTKFIFNWTFVDYWLRHVSSIALYLPYVWSRSITKQQFSWWLLLSGSLDQRGKEINMKNLKTKLEVVTLKGVRWGRGINAPIENNLIIQFLIPKIKTKNALFRFWALKCRTTRKRNCKLV